MATSAAPRPARPPSARPLRIAVVEDDGLLRALLRRTLESERGMVVAAVCADGAEALRTLDPEALDVVLLGVDLGDGPTGIEVGRELRARRPGLAVALLSSSRVPGALDLLAGPDGHGGLAYLLKESVAEVGTLTRALRAVARGEVVVDSALARERGARAPPPTALAALTPRQRDVLRLVAAGYVNGAIAARLGLSEKTVENQLNATYRALEVDSAPERNRRVVATLRYLREQPLD
jgi:DNA-binding NarL/FixJ family response regulator